MLHLSMDKLYLQLNEDLEAIEKNESDPLKRMASAVSKIRDSLDNLKLLIVNNPFSEITEEIHFFKHVKPKFSSKLIYAYTTEESEKMKVQQYAEQYGSIQKGIAVLAQEMRTAQQS